MGEGGGGLVNPKCTDNDIPRAEVEKQASCTGPYRSESGKLDIIVKVDIVKTAIMELRGRWNIEGLISLVT